MLTFKFLTIDMLPSVNKPRHMTHEQLVLIGNQIVQYQQHHQQQYLLRIHIHYYTVHNTMTIVHQLMIQCRCGLMS